MGLLTPAVVHFGQAATVRAQRQQVLAAAFAAHPERFVNGRPQPAALPTAVWINPPLKTAAAQQVPGAMSVTADDRSVAPFAGVLTDVGATLITSPLVSQCR